MVMHFHGFSAIADGKVLTKGKVRAPSRNHFALAKGNIISKGKVRASPRNPIKQALKD